MLFQQSNTAPCIRNSLKGKVMGDGDEWGGGGVRCMRPLSSPLFSDVKSAQLYSVAQGGTATPTQTHSLSLSLSLTHTHTHTHTLDLLNSPGKGTASEQASVTHSSKNKLGSCENKAWEPWNSGVVKGVGSPVICGAEGTITGSRWRAGGNTEWQEPRQKGGSRLHSHSSNSIKSRAGNTACLPPPACCVFLLRARGVMISWRQIIPGDCKKNCHRFVSIFISDVTRRERHRQDNLWVHITTYQYHRKLPPGATGECRD